MEVETVTEAMGTASQNKKSEKKSRTNVEREREHEVTFYYFGTIFIFETTAVMEPLVASYSIMSEIFRNNLRKFKDAICADMSLLNSWLIGAKTKAEEENFHKWKANGFFQSIGHYAYVYIHKFHATFSATKYSQLEALWKVTIHEMSDTDKHAACEVHRYHDHFEPYFQNNDCFKTYVKEELGKEEKEGDASKERIRCLQGYQKELQKQRLDENDLLYEPPLPIYDWNEDHWNLRLYHTIKAALPDLHIRFTAKKGLEFAALQSELTNKVQLPGCYIFKGAPDMVINQTKVIMTTGMCKEEISDDSSAEENSIIEQSFQRHPMKSAMGSNLPEKLGELLAALYFALVCKFLRKLSEQRKIQTCSVNGLLLDKLIGGIHCKITGNMLHLGNVKLLAVEIRNLSGKQLNPQSLCYNLQLLQTW